ncbi:putative ankyrin-2 ankyrin [Paramyrothecium foliicola]|nr:putative ankyrin-2 ankyrin [Paramyrothecium foliicola]
MAEALGVAASVAGLVSLADLVFRLTFKFAKGVKSAKEDVQKLSDEVQSVAGILHRLALLASALDDAGHRNNGAVRLHHVHSCQQTLSKLEKTLLKAKSDFESGGRYKGLQRKLKWPFSAPETRDLLQDLDRHKETLNLALSATSASTLLQVLSKDKEQHDTLRETKALVKMHLNVTTRIDLQSQRLEVLNYFLRYNPQPSLARALKMRHPLTGLWLLEEDPLIRWNENANSKLWLNGIPGSGKTVLAGTLIDAALEQDNEATAVAYFFCNHADPKSHDLANILCTIASQVARQDQRAFEELEAYYRKLNKQRRITEEPRIHEMITILCEMLGWFERGLIIIDGIDECAGTSAEIVDVLASLPGRQDNISLAIFSRDEQDIRNMLEDEFEEIKISAHQADLTLYAAAEIERRVSLKLLRLKSPTLKDEIIQELAKGADGMFRWVSCQIDYLCELPNDYERRKALKSLPPTLHATYERILERIDRLARPTRELVRKALSWIVFADPPMTIQEMCQALSVSADDGGPDMLDEETEIDDIQLSLHCSSLVQRSTDGDRFELAHFTVKEFLVQLNPLDSKFGDFHLLSSKASYDLALCSLRFLMLGNFSHLPKEKASELKYMMHRKLDFPFYDYASMSWTRSALDNWDDESLLSLATEFFNLSRTPNFLSWALNFCYFHSNGTWSTWCLARDQEISNVEEDHDASDAEHSDSDGSASVISSVGGRSSDVSTRVDYRKGDKLPSSYYSESDSESDSHRSSISFRRSLSVESYEKSDDDEEPLSQTQLSQLIYDIRRVTFTPLHMAAMLGCHKLCIQLIKSGAQVETCSGFGTPLRCALLGPAAVGQVSSYFRTTTPGAHLENLIPSDEVISVLLASGASCASPLAVSEGLDQIPVVAIAMLASSQTGNFRILEHVLEAKSPIDGSLDWFRSLCEKWAASFPTRGAQAIDANSESRGFVLSQAIITAMNNSVQGLHDPVGNVKLADQIKSFQSVADEIFSPSKDLVLRQPLGGPFVLSEIKECIRYDDLSRLDAVLKATGIPIQHLVTGLRLPISLLYKAIFQKSSNVCPRLLQLFENHLQDNEYSEALVCALENGASELAPLLHARITSTSSQNELGDTIWHIAARKNSFGDLSVLQYLFEHRTPQECREALGLSNERGRTPLAEALCSHNYASAEVIINNCDKDTYYLRSTTPPLAVLVASIQSLEILQLLSVHGLFPASTPSFDPLQHINAEMHLEILDLLLAIFPYKRGLNGKSPLDQFLTTYVSEDWLPESMTLVLKHEMKTLPDPLEQTWELVCKSLCNVPDRRAYRQRRYFIAGLHMLVLEGGLYRYESKRCISGLTELTRLWMFPYPELIEGLGSLVSNILNRSTHQDYVRQDENGARLLKWAITAHEYDLIDELLSKFDADVHASPEGQSALEICCSEPTPTDIFDSIIRHSNPSRINNLDASTEGYGLIHLLAINKSVPSTVNENALRSRLLQLLEAGADPNLSTRLSRRQPLELYVKNQKTECACLLLKYGAHYGSQAANVNGWTPFAYAVQDGSMLMLERLINQPEVDRSLVMQTSIGLWTGPEDDFFVSGATLLHVAASCGNVDAIKVLLSENLVNDIDASSQSGHTAFHVAAISSQIEVLTFLADQGADINRRNPHFLGRTALHFAVFPGKNTQTIRRLLELKVLHLSDDRGMTPLDLASEIGNFSWTQELLDSVVDLGHFGSKISYTTQSYLATTLRPLIRKDDLDGCKDIFDRGCPIDVGLRCCYRCSPLLLALNHGSTQVADWLISKSERFTGSSCVTTTHSIAYSLASVFGQQTAVDFQRFERFTTLDLMLAHPQFKGHLHSWIGSIPQDQLRWLLEHSSAVHVAVICENLDGLREFLAYFDQQATFVSADGTDMVKNLMRKASPSSSPLHLAVLYGVTDIVKLLVENGVEVTVTNNLGALPIHEARDPDLVDYLLAAGSPVGPMMVENYTPLSAALKENNTAAAEHLVRRGADVGLMAIGWRSCAYTPATVSFLSRRGVRFRSKEKIWIPKIDAYSWFFDALDNMPPSFIFNSDFLRDLVDRLESLSWLSSFMWTEIDKKDRHIPLRMMRRRLRDQDIKSMFQSYGPDGFSALCSNAAHNLSANVDELLKIGCDIEYESHNDGIFTPLMIAASYGRLEVVKLLVRRGARLQYKSGSTWMSAVMAARHFPEVIQWILVSRFSEQGKIEGHCDSETDPLKEGMVRPWSGPRLGMYKLFDAAGQGWHESMLQYATRLEKIRRSHRGKVVVYNLQEETPAFHIDTLL